MHINVNLMNLLASLMYSNLCLVIKIKMMNDFLIILIAIIVIKIFHTWPHLKKKINIKNKIHILYKS